MGPKRGTDWRDAVADALLGGASDAIVATDAAGRIMFWNAGAERIFDFASNEALGRSLDIIIPERMRARHWEGYRHMMATGESRYAAGDLLAVPGLRKDGSQISLEFTISVVEAGGARIGLVATLRDVSKRFEELRDLRRRAAAIAPSA